MFAGSPIRADLADRAVLTHEHAGQLPGESTSIGPHANLCML